MTPRCAVALAGLALLAAACGGQRQDADEPSGSFRVEVAGASFPARQHIAAPVTLRIRVHNADRRTLPNVAVTVETRPKRRAQAPIAFGQVAVDKRLADPRRPIWIVDRAPTGAETAYTNTWALGPLAPGRTRQFVWHVVPARAGAFTVAYRLFPGLSGKARPAAGRTGGTFRVTVDSRPVAACVGDGGQVIRGKRAASGRCA
jgi:hypothetical protein